MSDHEASPIPPEFGPWYWTFVSHLPALRIVDGRLQTDLTQVGEEVCVEVCPGQIIKLKRIQGQTLEDTDLKVNDNVRINLWADCFIISIQKRERLFNAGRLNRPSGIQV